MPTTEAVQHKVVDTSQGPNERKSLAYLDAFLKLPFIGDAEKKRIHAAKLAVKLAKFAKLQRAINDLNKSKTKIKLTPVALLEKLMEIIYRSPLDSETESGELTLFAVQTPAELRPEIIISESFTS